MATALIIGANRGIGLECVKQYRAAGWDVLAACRNPAKAKELISHASECFAVDTASPASIASLRRDIGDRTLDLVFLVAGVFGPDKQSVTEVDYPGWLETMQINCLAFHAVANMFVGNLRKSPNAQLIAVTSGMGSLGDKPSGNHYAYRSSKAALNMVSRCLAVDLRDDKIAVAVINPGWVKTDMGGANASITVEQSVAGMRSVIAELSLNNSGRFLNYSGRDYPW